MKASKETIGSQTAVTVNSQGSQVQPRQRNVALQAYFDDDDKVSEVDQF